MYLCKGESPRAEKKRKTDRYSAVDGRGGQCVRKPGRLRTIMSYEGDENDDELGSECY